MDKTRKSVYQGSSSTWRTYNIVLSFCCIIISFLFGIGNVLYSTADSQGNIAKLYRTEPNYSIMHSYVHYLMWIPFVASLLLFLACWYNSTTLIQGCIGLIITDLVLSFRYYNVKM